MKLETALEVIANELMHRNYTQEGYELVGREGLHPQEVERVAQLIDEHSLPIALEPTIEAMKVYAKEMAHEEGNNSHIFSATQAYRSLTTPARGPRY